MAMIEEIADLIARLKNGDVEFYTRFQEEEWGCRYLGDGRYLRWTRNYMENRETSEEMSERELTALFSMINAKNIRYLRLRPPHDTL